VLLHQIFIAVEFKALGWMKCIEIKYRFVTQCYNIDTKIV